MRPKDIVRGDTWQLNPSEKTIFGNCWEIFLERYLRECIFLEDVAEMVARRRIMVFVENSFCSVSKCLAEYVLHYK